MEILHEVSKLVDSGLGTNLNWTSHRYRWIARSNSGCSLQIRVDLNFKNHINLVLEFPHIDRPSLDPGDRPSLDPAAPLLIHHGALQAGKLSNCSNIFLEDIKKLVKSEYVLYGCRERDDEFPATISTEGMFNIYTFALMFSDLGEMLMIKSLLNSFGYSVEGVARIGDWA